MDGSAVLQNTGLSVYSSHQRDADSYYKQARSTANIVLTVMSKRINAFLIYSHTSTEN